MKKVQLFIVLCLSLWSSSALSAAQDEHHDHHMRNLYAERKLALERAWAGAMEEDRQRARVAVRTSVGRGQPAMYAASAQTMTELRFILEGGSAQAGDLPLHRRVAGSLDLRVLPGAFSAADGERGDAMIIRVLPAYTRSFRRTLPEELILSLYWIGPDGRELLARREPVHRDALVLPGFEMYINAPASRPGLWRLVPEVQWSDQQARGVAVPVECVASLFESYDSTVSSEPADEREQAIRSRLERALMHGARDALDPPISDMLRGSPEFEPPVTLESADRGGHTFFIKAPGARPPRQLLLVVTPVLHEAEWSLVGAEGLAWAALAERVSAHVAVTDLPVSASNALDALEFLSDLEQQHPGLPVTLVLHGSDFGRLRLAMLRTDDALPFDRLVIDTALRGVPVQRLLEVETLVISPLEEEALGLSDVPQDGGPGLHQVRLIDPPVIAAPQLPGLIGDWLDSTTED